MKKFLVLLLICFVLSGVFAHPAKEVKDVNMAVMEGPTGFSSVMLPDYINLSVYPSPNEAVSRLVSGELDMAVIPANTAANLYAKGLNIKVLAIVGEGMLSVLGTDKHNNVISVPGAGGTPDHMAVLLYNNYERNYSVSSPAQVAQMLIAEKINLAILPQPFVSMVLSKNANIKVLSEVKNEWEKKTGTEQFPMSVLVVRNEFAKENKYIVEKVKNDYGKSVEKVLSNTSEAALAIEKAGIMKAQLAEPAIKDCAIVFKDGNDAKKELRSYFNVLFDLAPSAIGNSVPDDDFYEL